MKSLTKLVVFRVHALRYALPLAAVERIVRAVEVTAFPSAPVISGMIDVEGRILPVINLRRRFRLPERELSVMDQFLIARTELRTVVLVVDEVEGLIECDSSAIVRPAEIADGLERFQGVVNRDDGLVVIHDMETILSLNEQRALDKVMCEEVPSAT